MGNEPCQVTMLPAQIRRLAELSEESNVALGVSQFGSILIVSTGRGTIKIDGKGRTIVYTRQRKRT